MTCGIYKIALEDGRCYVGQSVNIERRWQRERIDLRNSHHHSPYLQRAWNKYGEDTFTFKVIEEVLPPTLLLDDLKSLLTEREQTWMDMLNSVFNVCRAAGSQIGFRHSEATRRQISETLKGRPGKPLSEEHRRRLREVNTGKVHTLEHRRKISDSLTGRQLSDKTRRSIGDANRGKEVSTETRAKLSASHHKKRTVLSSDDVIELVRLFGTGVAQKTLALQFGVSYSAVNHIVIGHKWQWLTGIGLADSNASEPKRRTLTEADVTEIVRLVNSGEQQNRIAMIFGVTPSAVNSIVKGRTWRWLTTINADAA